MFMLLLFIGYLLVVVGIVVLVARAIKSGRFPLWETVAIMLGVINGNLSQVNVEWSGDACVGVVMASKGYPGSYKTGFPIYGLDELDKDILVFHGGTRLGATPGQILTSGGRVLTVVATGKTIAEAREKVYNNISRIHFEGCHYRKDIALVKDE